MFVKTVEPRSRDRPRVPPGRLIGQCNSDRATKEPPQKTQIKNSVGRPSLIPFSDVGNQVAHLVPVSAERHPHSGFFRRHRSCTLLLVNKKLGKLSKAQELGNKGRRASGRSSNL